MKWRVVFGLWLLSATISAFEIAPSSVFPAIMDGFGIGPVAVSLIVSLMIGMEVVASVPIGMWIDRTDARTAIVAAAAVVVVSGAWGWYASIRGAFLSLLASRVLAGLAYVTIWNASVDVIGELFDSNRRGTAVGVFTSSLPGGFALGLLGGPHVADAFTWPSVFLVFPLLSTLGVTIYRLSSPGSGRPDPSAERVGPLTAKRTIGDRRVWTVSLMSFVAASAFLFFNSWMPSYLNQIVGLSLADSGAFVASFSAMGIVARSGGGAASDRLFDGKRRPVVFLSFVPTVLVLVAIPTMTVTPVLLLLLIVGGFSIQLSMGLFFAYARELSAGESTATVTALLTSVTFFGAFSSPLVAGGLIELTRGYLAAFGYVGALTLGGVVLAVFAPEPSG